MVPLPRYRGAGWHCGHCAGEIMTNVEIRRLKLWQGRIETEVEIAGSGKPLLYLHGPWGLAPDRAFVASLAETFTCSRRNFLAPVRGARSRA